MNILKEAISKGHANKLRTKKKITVVFLSGASEQGGAENSLFDLVLSLNQNSLVNPIVILPAEGPLLKKLTENDCQTLLVRPPKFFVSTSKQFSFTIFLKLFLSFPQCLTYFYQLLEVVRKYRPDFLHANGFKMQFVSVVISLFYSTRVVWHLRDIVVGKIRNILLIPTIFIFRPNLIANSKATLESIDFKNTNQKVIYNGFPIKNFSTIKHKKFQSELRLSSEKVIVALVAMFAPWKGHFLFLDLAKKLSTEYPQLVFLIFGDDIYKTWSNTSMRSELEKKIKDFNLSNNTFLMGVRSSEEIMSGIDYLVHCSTRPEPFGRVIIEAQLSRVPVVASRDGGVIEIIEDYVSGVLFRPGVLLDLEEKIKKLINQDKLREMIIENAFNSAREKFSIEQHRLKIEEFYLSMLS